MTAEQPEQTCNNCGDTRCGYASDVPCGNWKPKATMTPQQPSPLLNPCNACRIVDECSNAYDDDEKPPCNSSIQQPGQQESIRTKLPTCLDIESECNNEPCQFCYDHKCTFHCRQWKHVLTKWQEDSNLNEQAIRKDATGKVPGGKQG